MRFWVLSVALLTLVVSPAWAGKIRQAGSQARGGSSATPSNPRANPPSSDHGYSGSSSSSSSSDWSYGNSAGAFYGMLIWDALRIAIVIPQLALESRGPRPFVYESKPYARRGKGIIRSQKIVLVEPLTLVSAESYDVSAGPEDERAWWPGESVAREDYAPEADTAIASAEPTAIRDDVSPPQLPDFPPDYNDDWTSGGQSWAAQLTFDGAAIDSDTLRVRPRFRLFTPSRLEIDAEVGIYREALHGRDALDAGRDVDWMTQSLIHTTYRFAQSQAVQFRLGVGPRLMTTPDATFMGWDVAYGFDAFPIRPLILSGSISAGMVGSAFVTDVRGSVGVVVSAVEIMVGGERLAVGDAVFAGPTAGVRVWF